MGYELVVIHRPGRFLLASTVQGRPKDKPYTCSKYQAQRLAAYHISNDHAKYGAENKPQ